MLHKSTLCIQNTALVAISVMFLLVISTVFLANPSPVVAHSPTPTFGSPYRGGPGDGVSGRYGGGHYGIDFLLRWQGILAAAGGTIEVGGWFNNGCHDECQLGCESQSTVGFGLHVRINHGPADHPYRTYYGHLSVARKPGGTIQKGEWIGVSGDSGYTYVPGGPSCTPAPHLHFEVRHNGTAQGNAVNPDNEGGVSLWNDGEWSGANPAVSVPEWRYPAQNAYGSPIIVDDTPDNTGGFVKGKEGAIACPPETCTRWTRAVSGGYDGDYWWARENDNTVDSWAEWRPTSLPAFANYTVWAHIPCTGDASTEYYTSPTWQAPYQILHYDGTRSAIVDQLTLSRSGVCPRWIALGIYRGQAGAGMWVRLTDNTGETGSANRKVLADAVKFTRTSVGAFEAEDERYLIPRSGYNWSQLSSLPGYLGTGYMEATPNTPVDFGFTSNWTTQSPELQYRADFPTAGTYYVWIRGYGGTANDDSIHAGIDGQGPDSAANISGCNWHTGGWYWCNTKMDMNRATLAIGTPGLHTINLWMRENGFRVDRVLLTTDSTYIP
jgi:murein DD-endopeptidase MepM/ murein hydrolase activator NlpD